MEVLERLRATGVIPAAAVEDASAAIPAARAMAAGGIPVIEITFRTAAATAAIRAVAEGCPEMLVGAGTVIDLEQCKAAVAAGARFIVSPGFDRAVAEWCLAHSVAVIPGCATSSEIMAAMGLGLRVLKFFPANAFGGLTAMKSLAGPFGGVRFVPTGGVNGKNLREYLSASFVYAVGGSWLCKREDISSGNFAQITKSCAEASAIVREVRA